MGPHAETQHGTLYWTNTSTTCGCQIYARWQDKDLLRWPRHPTQRDVFASAEGVSHRYTGALAVWIYSVLVSCPCMFPWHCIPFLPTKQVCSNPERAYIKIYLGTGLLMFMGLSISTSWEHLRSNDMQAGVELPYKKQTWTFLKRNPKKRRFPLTLGDFWYFWFLESHGCFK